MEGQVVWPPAETGPGIFRLFRSMHSPVIPPAAGDFNAERAFDTLEVFDPSATILLHRRRAFSRLLEVVRDHDEGPV